MTKEQSGNRQLLLKLLREQKLLVEWVGWSLLNARKMNRYRRTEKVYRVELKRLQTKWNKFQSNHDRLSLHMTKKQKREHYYYKKHYFQSTKATYQKGLEYFTEKLAEFERADDQDSESIQMPDYSATVPSDAAQASMPAAGISRDESPMPGTNGSAERNGGGIKIKEEADSDIEIHEEKYIPNVMTLIRNQTSQGSGVGRTKLRQDGRETQMPFCRHIEKARALNHEQIQRLRQSLRILQRRKANAEQHLDSALEQENRYNELQEVNREEEATNSDGAWLVVPRELNLLQIQSLRQSLETVDEEEANIRQNLDSALEQEKRYDQQKAEYIADHTKRILNIRLAASLILCPES